MKSVARHGDVPESWSNRPCTQYPVDVFFPRADDRDGIAQAQAVCRACPLLAQCAAWAAEADLTECVVATVRIPAYGTGSARKRLRQIAARAEAAQSATAREVA
ncbi:WhiB family transcriptional regulator [Nocardia vinacea]|uniref:WhiB family transcriptional regulator n=1 Tax=Nocardia vinacea TaxID=96468 RepID=UPI0034153D32